MISRFSIDAHFDDGTPLTFAHDKPLTIKMGDAEPETYWAMVESIDSHGTPTYKLLPMDRA